MDVVGGCETCEIDVDAIWYSEIARENSVLKCAIAVWDKAWRAVISFCRFAGESDGEVVWMLNQGTLQSWGVWGLKASVSVSDDSPVLSLSFSSRSSVWSCR